MNILKITLLLILLLLSFPLVMLLLRSIFPTDKVKKFSCKMGWHNTGGYELVEAPNDPLHTGICNKYRCKWCGYVGMIDSQGNLF